MSALGDYVHYKTENYLKYGTARTGSTPQEVAQSLNAQREKNRERIDNLKSISKDTIDELTKRVANEDQQKAAREAAEKEVNFAKDLNKMADKVRDHIMENMEKDLRKKMKSIGKVTKLKQIQTDNSKVKIEKARKIRKRIYDDIDRFNKDTKSGKIINTEARLATIIKNFDEFFASLGLSTGNGQAMSSFFKIKANSSTLNALDEFIKGISLQDANKATFNGVFGEILVNQVGDAIQKATDEAVDEMIKKSLGTGLQTSQFNIDESMVSKSVADQFYSDTGINIYQTRSSQNKVDASITINGESVKASVKAYTPKGNVMTPHLQDVKLLTSLVTTEGQFANHWLNIHAATKPIDEQKNVDYELSKHMQYEALVSGNLLKKDSSTADTFVAIDVVNGRVYVQRTQDMLNSGANNFIMRPDLSSIKIRNEWADSWEARISNILQQIHQTKISIMYRVQLESKNK